MYNENLKQNEKHEFIIPEYEFSLKSDPVLWVKRTIKRWLYFYIVYL